MPVLAIDTATNRACAAVSDRGVVLAEHALDAPGEAARAVLGLVDGALHDAALTLAELELIAVGTGPGSFTGIRIGIATAAALAAATSKPIAGVTTFAGVLHGRDVGSVGVIDARRGEVFVRAPGRADRAWSPAALAEALAPHTVVVGDGALRYREVFRAAGLVVPDDAARHVVSAGALALAALAGAAPTPTYLRDPDAIATVPA